TDSDGGRVRRVRARAAAGVGRRAAARFPGAAARRRGAAAAGPERPAADVPAGGARTHRLADRAVSRSAAGAGACGVDVPAGHPGRRHVGRSASLPHRPGARRRDSARSAAVGSERAGAAAVSVGARHDGARDAVDAGARGGVPRAGAGRHERRPGAAPARGGVRVPAVQRAGRRHAWTLHRSAARQPGLRGRAVLRPARRLRRAASRFPRRDGGPLRLRRQPGGGVRAVGVGLHALRLGHARGDRQPRAVAAHLGEPRDLRAPVRDPPAGAGGGGTSRGGASRHRAERARARRRARRPQARGRSQARAGSQARRGQEERARPRRSMTARRSLFPVFAAVVVLGSAAHAVEPGLPSRTAVWAAAARAVGAKNPDRAQRNPDYLAIRFLGPRERALLPDYDMAALDAPSFDEAMKRVGVHLPVRSHAYRTIAFDRALLDAVPAGGTQVVILGAGFDSRGYRFAHQLRGVRFMEVDYPPTQEYKKRRVEEILGALPPAVSYVPMDFTRDDLLTQLAKAGYSERQRTFFLWEGVVFYLPEDAVKDTLHF